MTANPPPEHPWHADDRRWSAMMVAAHGGDSKAYRELLAELGEVVERYIRVRFGSPDALEDCVQECLLTIHRARHTYDPARPFRPWLFTLVRHRTIDVLRSAAARPLASDTDRAREFFSDPDVLHRRLDGVRILESLAPDHREAIALTHYGGLTAAEAADWLGISESALKARLRRGLRAVRRLLEAEDLPT